MIPDSGFAVNKLEQVYVPIVNQAVCADNYGQNQITDRMICAGKSQGGIDACSVRI